MPHHDVFGWAALLLSVGANVPYIREILQGKVRPERISWLIWTLLGLVYFLTAVRETGAVLFTFGELIGPVIVLLLSLKFGVGGKSKFDMVSLLIALLAIVLLLLVKNSLLSLSLALFADAIGIVLTIRKLKIDPSSESRLFWALGSISSIFALLSLTSYNAETLAFPVYVLGVSSYIAWHARLAGDRHNFSKLEQL